MIDPLADPGAFRGDPAEAFDVIVPSLPGFGFSTTLLNHPDMNFWKIADLWQTLMTDILGYDKYAAAGCDVGALVTGQLGHKYSDELYAIHIGSAQKLSLFNGDRAWDLAGGRPLPDNIPERIRSEMLKFDRCFASHLAVHVLDSGTRLRPERLSGGNARMDLGTMGQLERQYGNVEECLFEGRHPYTRNNLLGQQRHRNLDARLCERQPLSMDTLSSSLACR